MAFGGAIKLTGESEYRKALKTITDNLTVLSSEMKVVNSAYDKNDSSTAKLAAQNDVLSKKLVEQNKKLEETKKVLDEARKSTDANEQTIKKWETEVNKAQAAVNETTNDIKKNTAQMEENEKAVDGASDAVSKFASSEDDAGRSAISLGDLIKANVVSDAIIGGLKSFGSALVDAGKQFLGFVKGGVQNASDLTEVQNVVDTVFGQSAKKIEDFAKTAATQFGMTELSVKNYAGSMGAMLDSMGIAETQTADMSLALVGLAGDMASFYNLDHDTAWEKIRSGISGETEPLKQLGINMSVANLEAFALSQGIEKAYSEMTAAEQATLRYNYLMETTANAQGDFAKTSDSFANQQKILELNMQNVSTAIGTSLLPALNECITAINGMITGEISMSEGVGQLTQIVVDLANRIVESLPMLLNAGMTMLQTIVDGFITALPEMMPAVTQMASQFLMFVMESLPTIVDAGLQIIIAVANGIGQALPELVPAAVAAVLDIATTLIDNVDFVIDAALQLMIGLAEGCINAIPVIIGKIPQIISSIVSALIRYYPKIMASGAELLVKLGMGLVSAIPQLVGMIPQIISGIVNGFKKGISQIKTVGVDLLKGLWEGITSWASTLWRNITNLGKNIVNNFKKALGINSPSLVMKQEVGVNMGLGVSEGFTETMASMRSEMAESIPTTFDTETNVTGTGFDFETLVSAFRAALKGVSVVMDGDKMGEFVTDTVTHVVYN